MKIRALVLAFSFLFLCSGVGFSQVATHTPMPTPFSDVALTAYAVNQTALIVPTAQRTLVVDPAIAGVYQFPVFNSGYYSAPAYGRSDYEVMQADSWDSSTGTLTVQRAQGGTSQKGLKTGTYKARIYTSALTVTPTKTNTKTNTPSDTPTVTLTPTQTPLTNQAFIGATSGSGVSVAEYGDGIYHQSVFTLTAFSIPVTSITTGVGVGGTTFYTFPEGMTRFEISQGNVTISVAAGQQADFTDNTPEGDFGIGSVAMENTDSFGTDATDDDFSTGAPIDMVAFSDDLVMNTEAAGNFNGNTTAIKLNANVLIDAADIDNDVVTSVKLTGVLRVTWTFGGNLTWWKNMMDKWIVSNGGFTHS